VDPEDKSRAPVKDKSAAPVPPAKPTFIHDKNQQASSSPSPKQLVSGNSNTTHVSPPVNNQVTSPRSMQQPRPPSIFHMRSASSGSSLISTADSQDLATQQSMLDRKRKFENTAVARNENSCENTSQQTDELQKGTSTGQMAALAAVGHLESDTNQRNSAMKSDADEYEEECRVLKPSQLFRKPKKVEDPNPVSASQNNALPVTEKPQRDNIQSVDVVKKEDDDIMRASFSDRRKLFEATQTDSSNSTLMFGSLKRKDVPMVKNILRETSREESSATTTQDTKVSDRTSYSAQSQTSNNVKKVVSPTRENIAPSDISSKARNYGQKSIVIQSKDDPTAITGTQESFVDNGNKNKTKEQKENVKPPVVFKSYEKDLGIDQKERSGTVKDLWRKFEQQNN
jgi:hypothetical protein